MADRKTPPPKPYLSDPNAFDTALRVAVDSHQPLAAPPGHTSVVGTADQKSDDPLLMGWYHEEWIAGRRTAEDLTLYMPVIRQEAARRGVPFSTMRDHVLTHERLHEWGLLAEGKVEKMANLIVPL